VDLELAPAGSSLQPVGSWILGNTDFQLLPRQHTDVDSTCSQHPRMENVFAVFPHMHRMGSSIRVLGGTPQTMTVLPTTAWDFSTRG